jgi:peroxiredoxin
MVDDHTGRDWGRGDVTVTWVLLGVVVVLVAGVVATWFSVYGVLAQNGRLLVRMTELEEQVDQLLDAPAGRPQVRGIDPGTPLPDFSLTSLDGQRVGLDTFAGRRALLVHWDPGCGFCRQIAPQLAELAGGLAAQQTELVLVSHGDEEANRALAAAHRLEATTLLQREDERAVAFDGLGTPCAYLVDERGRVAKPLAVGANEVPRLAAHAAARKALGTERPLSESRLVRNGITPGTVAPSFTAPAVGGGTVALDDFRGRRLLLVFSDPHCGPCNELLPRLADLHRGHEDNGLAIAMISRGEEADNRTKVEAHGVSFPVGIQPGWNISKTYGIFETPVAFLIDEQGRVARQVSRGRDAVLELAHDAMAQVPELAAARGGSVAEGV